MRIALVADRNTYTCFKLAGLKDVYLARTVQEAEKYVTELSEIPDLAILIITQRLVNQMSETIEKVAEQKYPIIIPIPDTKGDTTVKTDLIVDLIRRKAGIEVKL